MNKPLTILGIGYLTDAGTAVIRDGKIIAAISEERLNRKKNWYGFPRLSLEWILKETNLSLGDIDYIATHDGTNREENRKPYFEVMAQRIKNSPSMDAAAQEEQLKILWKKFDHVEYVIHERSIAMIREIEALGRPVRNYHHHLCHASAAYFTSGWDECHILTIDGWGGDASNTLSVGKNGKITRIAQSPIIDSLGYFYGSITKYLGFTPERHEGKVLGLSAHGDASKLAPLFRKMIGFDAEAKSFRGYMEQGIYVPYFDNPHLPKHLDGFSKEDIAAAAQHVLEEVILAYVAELVPAGSKLAVAGGVFANVLLNQKILQLPNIAAMFVYPNMGDGGHAMGAALYATSELMSLKPFIFSSPYLGPEYSDDDYVEAMKECKVTYQRIERIEAAVAKLLAEGNVVARFNGRMEYGPRALGNRSMLFKPDDVAVNDWLNKKLHRTEFMPFAPVTLAEHAGECYELFKNIHEPARFMTITCQCTPGMKKQSPGVVHLDGTARPQIVTREQNPSYYGILEEFYKLTGNPTLINTSFNMHEEPIVCSPRDAVRGFLAADIPYLAMGNYLITK